MLLPLSLHPQENQEYSCKILRLYQSLYMLFCFAAAIAVAALVTYLFEKPIYKKGTKSLR